MNQCLPFELYDMAYLVTQLSNMDWPWVEIPVNKDMRMMEVSRYSHELDETEANLFVDNLVETIITEWRSMSIFRNVRLLDSMIVL